MNSDAEGETTEQGAVMPTSPANAPFNAMVKSGFPHHTQAVNIAAIAPALGARVVFIATLATTSGSSKPRVEPALNPNHPNQRIKTPMPTNGILCPAMT